MHALCCCSSAIGMQGTSKASKPCKQHTRGVQNKGNTESERHWSFLWPRCGLEGSSPSHFIRLSAMLRIVMGEMRKKKHGDGRPPLTPHGRSTRTLQQTSPVQNERFEAKARVEIAISEGVGVRQEATLGIIGRRTYRRIARQHLRSWAWGGN